MAGGRPIEIPDADAERHVRSKTPQKIVERCSAREAPGTDEGTRAID
jgi:hypothetical protein